MLLRSLRFIAGKPSAVGNVVEQIAVGHQPSAFDANSFQGGAEFAAKGSSRTAGRTYVPVPVSVTFCGLPPPSSLILTTAVRVPWAVGLKVTVIVQFAPPGMLVPQVLVWE